MPYSTSLPLEENLTILLNRQARRPYSSGETTPILLTKAVWNLQDQIEGGGLGLPDGGTTNQVLAKASNTDQDATWVDAGSGSGDVTAAAAFAADNRIIRSNGTGKGVQPTGITVDDSNNVTGVAGLTADSVVAPEVAISATHATDDTFHGVTLTGLLAGATIAQWEVVYLGGSSTWLLADANGSGTYPARGLAVASYASTDPAKILVHGTARNDAWSWTPGGDLYVSATAGGITQTAPSTAGDKVQKIGFALTADVIFVNFGTGEYLTVSA